MATYIPNATQTTEPVESRTVESAALEFRTLKTSITARIEDVQDGLDTEIVNRIAGDANLQTQNNAQDVRLQAIEAALLVIGEGGLPGTVYVQRLSGTGAQTSFTLDVSVPSSALIDVFINGIYQNKNTFTIVDDVLTFSEAPPAGTDNVEVVVSITIANVETDASLVSFRATDSTVVVRTAQDKMREWVSIKDFGGSPNASPEQNASALVAAFSAHNQVYFPDGVYEFSYPVASGNNSLVTITDRAGIRITGRGATLKDVSAYAGDYLTDVFKFVRCKDIYVDLNYDAIPLSNPVGAYPEGIGYVGSSFLYFEEGCTNIKVDSRIDNARYGVRSGGYSAPSYGYCSKFDLRLTCYKTGYPAALYLAGDVVVDIHSDYQHRALYLAGCNNVRGSVTYTGFTYATVAVLLTSSVTVVSAVDADRRARGCSGVDLLVVDNGSFGTVSTRAIAGLAQQWKAPDTFFDDVQLHVAAKTSDANRTLAAFRLENTLGWYATNRFSNLKISGVIDRSAQTLAASSWANISIDGINSGEASPYSTSPKFSNVVFEDFNVINGAVTGNFDTIRVPNLENRMTFSRFHTGTTLSLIARAGEVSVDKSTVGNFVTGDIVARLNLLESTYGTIGSGITAYPFQWYAGSTFTPVLVGSTTAGVGTYTAQLGYYTRIGNRVHFHLNLGWSAHTGTGNMKITGLPFTSSNSTFCPVTIVPADITSPAGTSIAAMVPANEAAINLYSIATATSVFATLVMDTSGSCWIGGSYEAA